MTIPRVTRCTRRVAPGRLSPAAHCQARKPSPAWGPLVAARRPGTLRRWLGPVHRRALRPRSRVAVRPATTPAGVTIPGRRSRPRRPRHPRGGPPGTEGAPVVQHPLHLRWSRPRFRSPPAPSGRRPPHPRRDRLRLPLRQERCRRPPWRQRRDRPGTARPSPSVRRCCRACGCRSTPTAGSGGSRPARREQLRRLAPGERSRRPWCPQQARAPLHL